PPPTEPARRPLLRGGERLPRLEIDAAFLRGDQREDHVRNRDIVAGPLKLAILEVAEILLGHAVRLVEGEHVFIRFRNELRHRGPFAGAGRFAETELENRIDDGARDLGRLAEELHFQVILIPAIDQESMAPKTLQVEVRLPLPMTTG